MDQPQHQVFEAGHQSYRYMSYPFQKQPLHLLYPGRVMQQDWHYTGENIPNEDPDGLKKTRFGITALDRAAKMEQEALARHLGGKYKIVNHPAVEPEAIIEDLNQTNSAINTSTGVGADLDVVPSDLDDLQQIEEISRNIARDVRKGSTKLNLSEDDTDPSIHQEGDTTYTNDSSNDSDNSSSNDSSNVVTNKSCHGGSCTTITCDYGDNTCTSVTCDKHGDNCDPIQTCDWSTNCKGNKSRSAVTWIPIIVIGILAIVFIVLIIYGIHKHRSHATAVQPKSFNVISPEYIPSGSMPDVSGIKSSYRSGSSFYP